MIDPASPDVPAAIPSGMRTVIRCLLLFVGVQFSLLLLHAQWPPKMAQNLLLLALLLLACIPPFSRALVAVLDLIRQPSRRGQCLIAIGICIVASIALYAEARNQMRTFSPRFQDEFSYLIGTRMIAHGRLWMPAHPLAEFFTTFQLLASPVYASCYFPGAAMLFAPGVWLALPFWMMPLVISGACAGLIYLVFTELIDGVAGMLGAAMLVALGSFRLMSVMAMAQSPALMLALSAILAWLRWRENQSAPRAALIGVCIGWLAITRPVDALCVIAPLGIAMLFDLRASERRANLRSCVSLLLAVAPLVMIQLIFDFRVTGSPLRTPFELMSSMSYPQTAFGFRGFDPSVRPPVALPQFQKYYDMDVVASLKQHATVGAALREWGRRRLSTTLVELAPGAIPLILAPLGLLGLTDRRRWVVFALLPMFVLLYFFYVFFLPHYTVIAIPAMLLSIALGANVIECALRQPKRHVWIARGVRAFVPLAIAGLCITESSAFNKSAFDDPYRFEELSKVDEAIATIPQPRAIVLFRFGDTSSPHLEPVYNIDVTWPDDARVIRAHDRGDAENVTLYRYYDRLEPDRAIYRYDRGDGSMTYLGTAHELARRVQSNASQRGD